MSLSRPFLLFLAAALLTPALAAQSRSPFLPPRTDGAPAAATEDAPLQFVGLVGAGENMMYCLYDPARRRSMWMKVGGEQGTVRLQGFDSENRTVSVVQNGRSMTLRLQTAKVPGGGGGGATASGPLPVAGTAPNLVNTVVPNPTPADEAKRLEAVAAEVRRRRALRQAAAQNQGQPVPEAPAGN